MAYLSLEGLAHLGDRMKIRLPSRYENLDPAFRGRLKPEVDLIAVVKQSYASLSVAGGIRFLPVYGKSGCGKSCGAWELATHLPECEVIELPREAIESVSVFMDVVQRNVSRLDQGRFLVFVIDQYEEAVAARVNIPTQFVEQLSLLDRSPHAVRPMLFLWLTTSREFQRMLAEATSRNRRILAAPDFELKGPLKHEWPDIIQETFKVHNEERTLADFDVLEDDLIRSSQEDETLGAAIESVASKLGARTQGLQDLSTYQVVMLWPVTDGQRIARVTSFTHSRDGYKLDWNAWYRELNADDRRGLPLHEFNRARLYFDVRLVPIAAADLHPLCKDLEAESYPLHQSYLVRLRQSHFFSIIGGGWTPENFSPLRERDSDRAKEAREWYEKVTTDPVRLSRRLAKCLRALGLKAEHEQEIRTRHGAVRADLLVERAGTPQPNVIVELKAFSAENTRPSSIRDAVRITLRRHAQLAGFLERQ